MGTLEGKPEVNSDQCKDDEHACLKASDHSDYTCSKVNNGKIGSYCDSRNPQATCIVPLAMYVIIITTIINVCFFYLLFFFQCDRETSRCKNPLQSSYKPYSSNNDCYPEYSNSIFNILIFNF